MAISTSSPSAGVTSVKSDINVTPMIDVMLVLLIIFMIVTPLIAAGFKATLPKGKNLDSRPEGDNEVVLGIDESGQYFLNGRPLPDAALADQLRSIYASRSEDKILYFKADNHLKYSRIQDAVETARQAGVRVMSAITEPVKGGMFGDLSHDKEKK
ncbi:MAG TPA: biopolymer transporter ExbD [Gemmatimonadales bacterium]|nr:biopolymer transporter ExbD [Gemmatimonadales bacterium]